ncbi:MAG TPA: polyprenyl synthetase family protein, partial [Actinomycetota bacterium]|nr:polyprenyl synthetase family protein [Actinomycetota bacterium]
QARAILTGDALMSLASEVVLESRSPNRLEALAHLAHAVTKLNEGQQLDLSFESRLDVSVEECLEMVGAKTSALMACSAAIGAVFAGAPKDVVEGLESFGRHLGAVFQGVDDLLGIWGDPAATGKPVCNDLREKKKSLPVAYGLSSPSGRLRQILTLGALAGEDVKRASELLERIGARHWVGNLVDRELDLALAALEPLPIPEDIRSQLQEVARFAATRKA